jgi:NADH-quinone oxidoreductase subunit N
VLDSQFYWLAIVGVINTVLSLYYYARILKAMYLETGGSDVIMRVHPMYSLLLVLLGAPVLILGIYWNPVVEYVQYCAQMMG